MDYDMEFQESFGFYDDAPLIETPQEPEWVLLNRQWTSEHPSVLYEKRSPSLLDGWVTCLGPERPTLNWNSDFSSLERSKKCFIDKIDLKSLVDDPDSFNIDNLFAETDDHSSSCDSKSRKWDKSEENKLLRFIGSCSKFSLEMWKKIALELGRSINSVRIKAAQLKKARENSAQACRKPTLTSMIFHAIKNLPEENTTKELIIKKIEETYGTVSQKRWKDSVKQLLNSCFKKNLGVYQVKDVGPVEYKKCNSMGDYIVWVLVNFGPLNRCKIKEKILEHFDRYLNRNKTPSGAEVWELTFIKKLKTCKNIDCSLSKTTFAIS